LRADARVADVGCGTGQALIALARAFPAITGTGYDAHPPVLEQARRAAEQAGVADRISYQVLDAAAGLPESFDVITTFDVVHDAVDPLGLLRSIRDALQPGGTYLCLEINCSDQAADNIGPIATLLYGFSVLYCMTTSLAEGGWRGCWGCWPIRSGPGSCSRCRRPGNCAWATWRWPWRPPRIRSPTR